mmetsp:Transcript_58533/g.128343  ORF Transcript_58533/g.128343 Transcript_58533/m.128343 type:complete len:265 (-) Transcript_58533:291-1085(-)
MSGKEKVSAQRNLSGPAGPTPILVSLKDCRARFSTLRNKMAKDEFPTPPGTGVIFDATLHASSKHTSPTTLAALFPSDTTFIPASTTTHPGFSQLPLTNPGRPTQATRISARFTTSGISGVWEWQTVTVQSWSISRAAMCHPTVRDRPSTTACFPTMGTLLRKSSSRIPAATAGRVLGSHRQCNRPRLWALNPSASFHGGMEASRWRSSRCGGRGISRRIPWTEGSFTSWEMVCINCSWLTFWLNRRTWDRIPHRSAIRALSSA